MALIALIVFWASVAALWVNHGPRISLIFIALWVAGYFAFQRFDNYGYFFMSFQAVLAAILLLIIRFKSAMRKRGP